MVSRLPITVRPAAGEIAVSYLGRLAELNCIPFADLWSQASRRTNGKSARLDGDLLATISGEPRARLAAALMELRDPEPDWLALRHEPQRGCWRCNARHPGGVVTQLLGHHRYVCTRHRIWIGPPDHLDHPQPSLDELPEIVRAQHAHLRMLRRFGAAATYDAVLTGFLICAHRWNPADTPSAGNSWHQWVRRAELLVPPGTEAQTFSTSRLFAATYPEAVSIAELIGSLHWRRLAAGGPDDQRRFAAEIGRRLGLTDYRPTRMRDPIAHWIEQDCWQPPSLPSSNYRTLRTFAGKTFRKPDKRSAESRDRSAHWFAMSRGGGGMLLHHRTLTPVLIRDWSVRMEMFVGALDASASTTIDHTTRSTVPAGTTLADSEFVRPAPVGSAYLANATEPVPWAERSEPRRPKGARPWLPNERPKVRFRRAFP